jgi:hypothetical protein
VKFIKQSLSIVLSWCLVLTTALPSFAEQENQPASQTPVTSAKQVSGDAPTGP